MPTQDVSPFAISQVVHEGRSTIVLRGVRTADRVPVILKVLDRRRSRPRDLERLKHEYEIGKQLDLPTIVKPLGLETYEGMPALVMEDFGGESLDRLLGAPMPIERFLVLASRIASALADLHQRDVIHKDLKPQNILVNAATAEVKLSDFGLAVGLPREHKAPESPSLIEGSLPYLSPEQTGRMNRAIDSRADLYALGVTFYEMLTGRLPFEAVDALEWVHCQIARVPEPPGAWVPALPEVLSALVMKLLAKMAEDRYQTARGLQHDLERSLAEWRAKGRIDPFPLAEHDASGRLEIPQKLYGRAEEIAALLGAFERVAGTGSPEVVQVSGHPGIGKSSLVHELYKPVARARGFFISGKFDPYNRDIPYATFVRAFRELVLEILAGSEERIAAFRRELERALGVNGQLVVDVIPEVELVVGRQPPVAELPPTEAQNRFRIVFRHFIGVFAREPHPLVLFLDDLQWADAESLGLLRDLVTHPEVRHLLLIGAHRDNEVTTSHPLVRTIDEVRKEGTRVSSIVLGPLSREDLATLLGDALHCPREQVAPLADLVHEKTAGNPFFAIQFLTALHEERLIEFDEHAEAFRWEVQKIREKNFTDNVVGLMVGKLARLPEGTREALTYLACLGSTAEVAVFSMVRGGSEAATHAELWEAVRAGLVFRFDGMYKFLHDRVQEAAYSLVPEGERAALHLAIGRLLVSRTPPERREEKIFEIVNQLDRGAALITSQEERERVAELDLLAGKRAEGATAHASALKYLAAGSALLARDGWDRRYELTFALEHHRAECEFLTGELSAAEARLGVIWRHARGVLDRAALTCTRIALYTTMDRSDLAVDACREYLELVGVTWPARPTDDEVRREYERLWQRLGGRPIEALVDLPRVTDPVCRATMDVLTAVQSPAMFTDENLHCLVVGRMANLSLEHGNSDGSCLAYVRLGMILGPRFGAYQAGFRFGKVGFDLQEKLSLLRFKARVYLDFGALVNPWTRHLRVGLPLLRRAQSAAEETGDLLYASYTRNCAITLVLAAGDPLDDVQREAEASLAFARKARFGLVVDILTGQLQLIRHLRGLTGDVSSLDDDPFDERRFEQHLAADPRLAIAACWYWIRKLQARFFAGDAAAAVASASKAEPLLWTSPSFFEIAEYHFHAALARATRHDEVPADERAGHLAALVAHHGQLAVWAESCPENFAHRVALVAAEIARISGEEARAEQMYEQAIRSACENGFVQDEAIAYEMAARFHHARGFELFADTYLREARARYLRWGADAKARQLDALFPPSLDTRLLGPTATVVVQPAELDLLSVTKASQTISSEITFDKLSRTLLTVVLEQSGAQRGALIRCKDGEASIAAEASLEARGISTRILPARPISSSDVPVSIVTYAFRTKERVILDDAFEDPRYAADPYITRVKPRSLLGLPILRQGEATFLLYLENNVLSGAFTPARLVALSLLASQAAISLENALLLEKEQAARAEAEAAAIDNERLYHETQQAIRVRDEFLTVASHELNTPVTSLKLTLQSMNRAIESGRGGDLHVMGRLVERGLRQATRLARLNKALVDVSQLHAGLLLLEREDVDLAALVRKAVDQLAPELAQARCPVHIRGGPHVVGHWDPERVDQILTNLLSNAIKFGAGKPIEVSFGEERGIAWVVIRDHGIGIDPARRDQIFERFERAASENYGGLGLGLYISRRIAEAHGGTLRVQSEVGAGSVFTVELPCDGQAASVRENPCR
ncbi:ATP-binding sensor histidine kinase [Polyangium spumosum]|uniref:histidine kinase n=1 Tax=Polyangium spumosum TaxID=889282 RepID=A0A6N7PIQ1_9BACT|nr:ATP-binding sensor histidine kinase [Polyangium spumosum]MRG91992.1 AAA family ATPase [Polyangium spumosum]